MSDEANSLLEDQRLHEARGVPDDPLEPTTLGIQSEGPKDQPLPPFSKQDKVVWSEGDPEEMRRLLPNLALLSDEMLRSMPIMDAVSLNREAVQTGSSSQGTSSKLKANEVARDRGINLPSGRDNGSTELHCARFRPLPAGSDTMWVKQARDVVGETGWPACADYDLSGLGLDGLLSSKAYLEIANPASDAITLKLFSSKNSAAFCRENRSISFDGTNSFSITESLQDLSDRQDIREACWSMLVLAVHVRPYDRSTMNLYSFLTQKNFLEAELKPRQVGAFVDHCLSLNRSRWLSKKAPLSVAEMESEYISFKNRRLQLLQNAQPLGPSNFVNVPAFRQQRDHQARDFQVRDQGPRQNVGFDACINFNKMMCDQQAKSQCSRRTKSGMITRPHTCSFVMRSGVVCGRRHPALRHT